MAVAVIDEAGGGVLVVGGESVGVLLGVGAGGGEEFTEGGVEVVGGLLPGLGGGETGEVAIAVEVGEVGLAACLVVDPEEGAIAVAEVEGIVVVEAPGEGAGELAGGVEFAEAAPTGVEVAGRFGGSGGTGGVETETLEAAGVGVVGIGEARIGDAGRGGGGGRGVSAGLDADSEAGDAFEVVRRYAERQLETSFRSIRVIEQMFG